LVRCERDPRFVIPAAGDRCTIVAPTTLSGLDQIADELAIPRALTLADEYPDADVRQIERRSVAEGDVIENQIEDPTAALLKLQVDQFVEKVREGDVVMVYYAGHGVQVGGQNYLLPSDFPNESTSLKEAARRRPPLNGTAF
jgi:hypothetical protein